MIIRVSIMKHREMRKGETAFLSLSLSLNSLSKTASDSLCAAAPCEPNRQEEKARLSALMDNLAMREGRLSFRLSRGSFFS